MDPNNQLDDTDTLTAVRPEQAAPQDALERTNEELNATTTTPSLVSPTGEGGSSTPPPKRGSPLQRLFHRFNVYLFLFLLVIIVGIVISVVAYLNSRRPSTATIATQQLTQDALKQLANSDATVGDSGQTLTVQGNAIFSGQALIRSNLNVAGTIQTGQPMNLPGLTVSGATNLNATQVNSLQVANGASFQGSVTIQHDLNVAGAASFSGTLTAGQITASRLILSGNAQLQVPNHISFTGPSPSRSINASVLGGGGSASVNGSDTSGTVNVNSGNGPTAGCFITMTFSKAFSTTPHVVVTPAGSAAGQLQWYVNRSSTSFSICSNNAAPANQVFAFDYFVTE